jgi:hypothetical protein
MERHAEHRRWCSASWPLKSSLDLAAKIRERICGELALIDDEALAR